MTEELDYLVDIGATAIWITPFFESPLESGGYDISNYLDVQHIFGTMDDFKDLLNAAHSKSMCINYIYNYKMYDVPILNQKLTIETYNSISK